MKDKLQELYNKSGTRKVLASLISILIGLVVGAIVVIAVGMVVIVAGELFRMSRLPKDIKAHLTDSGRRKL